MSSKYVRQLPPTLLAATFKQTDQQAGDFGGYRQLGVYIKILKAGGSGTVSLSHNATLDPDNWKAITGASLVQTGSDLFIAVSDFLRYVRVEAANGDGATIALVDIVAKE